VALFESFASRSLDRFFDSLLVSFASMALE